MSSEKSFLPILGKFTLAIIIIAGLLILRLPEVDTKQTADPETIAATQQQEISSSQVLAAQTDSLNQATQAAENTTPTPTQSPLPTLFPTPLPTQPNTITAIVTRIVDGDTLEINTGQKVRLIGINTPETGECYAAEATNKLSELVLHKEVQLAKDVSETDKYGRLLRYIYLHELFVNEELVKTGFAQAASYPPDVKFQKIFQQANTIARNNNLGLWAGCQFEPKQQKPAAQNIPTSIPASNEDCKIKGNISTKTEEKIYHLPDQVDYKKTVIDASKGERWFCSETEAINAGWRKALR